MGRLQDFLNNNTVDNMVYEVAVSERFKDEKGNILKFKVRALNDKEFDAAHKKATKYGKKGKVEFNVKFFNNSIVIGNTIEPNFKDAESIKKLGVSSPEEYLGKVMLAGEINALADKILLISGFDDDGINDDIEEIKNS